MDNEKQVHEGEILMLLVKRSKMEGLEVAKSMGINQSYLSKLYNQPRLTSKVKVAASRVLAHDVAIFDTGIGYEIPEQRPIVLEDGGNEYARILDRVKVLEEENARMAADLLREKGVSDDLRKVLVKIAGGGVGE